MRSIIFKSLNLIYLHTLKQGIHALNRSLALQAVYDYEHPFPTACRERRYARSQRP
jgi:hypothetical protein